MSQLRVKPTPIDSPNAAQLSPVEIPISKLTWSNQLSDIHPLPWHALLNRASPLSSWFYPFLTDLTDNDTSRYINAIYFHFSPGPYYIHTV